MTAISDIPIVEPITGNKRHTYYSTATETDSKPALPTTTTAKATFPIPTIVQSPQKKISASKDSDKQPLLDNDQDSNSDSCEKVNEATLITETSMVSHNQAIFTENTAIVTKITTSQAAEQEKEAAEQDKRKGCCRGKGELSCLDMGWSACQKQCPTNLTIHLTKNVCTHLHILRSIFILFVKISRGYIYSRG